MKLEDIGFYTLDDQRAMVANSISPLHRCELLLTDRCNFNCPYCRKTGIKDISWEDAIQIIDYWGLHGIKNVRFSGGEPTLWENLTELVIYTKLRYNPNHIALSTNGSADTDLYHRLVDAGVNDFSISLDACCASTAEVMSGIKGWNILDKVLNNIRVLSKLTYVTLGVVLTEQNITEVYKICELALDLGVSDVRLISAAQWNGKLELDVPKEAIEKFPILRYRINNFKSGRNVRGIQSCDTTKCPLVLDDMAVMDGKHYPCIIFLREKGKAIGSMDNLACVRRDRLEWYNTTNTHEHPTCRKNCLDVCIDYNNKYEEIHNSNESI